VADEILNANVIRVTKDGDKWCALIGPDPQRGVMGFGTTPVSALWRLLARLGEHGWCWDETWRPR
jgi:hypothetical protein